MGDRMGGTFVDRGSDCGLVVLRMFEAPVQRVYRAWSEAALFRRWWAPKSVTGVALAACEMDVRTGGSYRLVFEFGGAEPMAFHGRYVEVVPGERIVWTNDEAGDEAGAVTTVTSAARDSQTEVTFQELYPSQEAREEALAGSAAGLPEQFAQLEAMIAGGEVGGVGAWCVTKTPLSGSATWGRFEVQ